MNKRGQVYILAAILIAFLLVSIINPVNFVHKRVSDDDFEELSKNYKVESAKLLNSLLNDKEQDPEDLGEYFLNFTLLFTSYSKTKNPNFGLIYAFPFENRLMIGNYIDQEVTFTPGGTIPGCFEEVQASLSIGGLELNFGDIPLAEYRACIVETIYPANDKLVFEIEEVPYTFSLDKERPDIVVVSREQFGEDIKVYTN